MKGYLIAALVVLVLVGRYVYRYHRYPYKTCPRCGGGRDWASGGKVFGDCRKCEGTGRRLRWDHRIFGRRDR